MHSYTLTDTKYFSKNVPSLKIKLTKEKDDESVRISEVNFLSELVDGEAKSVRCPY